MDLTFQEFTPSPRLRDRGLSDATKDLQDVQTETAAWLRQIVLAANHAVAVHGSKAKPGHE